LPLLLILNRARGEDCEWDGEEEVDERIHPFKMDSGKLESED
jgi:hypothetical protein